MTKDNVRTAFDNADPKNCTPNGTIGPSFGLTILGAMVAQPAIGNVFVRPGKLLATSSSIVNRSKGSKIAKDDVGFMGFLVVFHKVHWRGECRSGCYK
jgi:hypothetical protein